MVLADLAMTDAGSCWEDLSCFLFMLSSSRVMLTRY